MAKIASTADEAAAPAASNQWIGRGGGAAVGASAGAKAAAVERATPAVTAAALLLMQHPHFLLWRWQCQQTL